MVLLTTKHVGDGSALMAADFRDTHALRHKASSCFLGIDSSGQVRLVDQKTIKMVDGIWRADPHDEMNKMHSNVLLTPDLVSLEIIG